MPSTTTAGRSTVSDVTLRLSLMQTKGKVYNVTNTSESKEVKFELICPACQAVHVDQLYHCQAGCLPGPTAPASRPEGWKMGEIGVRGRWEGDQLVATATVEEVEAAKQAAIVDADVAEREIDLAVYRAVDVESSMVEAGNTYFFLPPVADGFYQMLVRKAADPDVALIGAFVVKKEAHIYRLRSTPEGLVLREVRRPEQTHHFAVEAGKPVSDQEAAMFDQLVGAATGDFDPEAYRSGRTAALKDMIAAKTGVAGVVVPIAKARPKADGDLTDTLQAALALIEAKKSA